MGGSTRAGALLSLCLLGLQPVKADTNEASRHTNSIELGRRLFAGGQPMQGRIASHPTYLPPEVIRCANCHAVGVGPSVARSIAPRLSRKWLLDVQPRRGGPATSYEASTFCTLLRQGHDPAYVLINMQMPRYEVRDDECTALWRFLTQADHEH